MPAMFKTKYAGLPLWAWLALAATGVAVGLVLKSRSDSGSESESEGDPCDPESEYYDQSKCNSVEGSRLNAGYDSADPCDPTSVTYDPAACQATAGIGYESAGGGAGPGGVYVESPLPPTEGELGRAEEGGIEPGSGLVEPPNGPLVQITQNVQQGKPCNKKKKPPAKKGFRIVCESGRWTYESEKHAGKKHLNEKHHKLTGGGAPHKRHNKTHKHGKRRKHKVSH